MKTEATELREQLCRLPIGQCVDFGQGIEDRENNKKIIPQSEKERVEGRVEGSPCLHYGLPGGGGCLFMVKRVWCKGGIQEPLAPVIPTSFFLSTFRLFFVSLIGLTTALLPTVLEAG